MTVSASIRPARIGECDAVAGMVREFAALFGVKSGTTGEVLRKHAFGATASIAILVAELDGRLVGYLIHQDTFSTYRGENGVFVVDLFVDPTRRNGGLGQLLLTEAARAGHARGARFMRLDLDAGNDAGARFYRRLGFRVLEEDRNLVIDGAAFGRLGA